MYLNTLGKSVISSYTGGACDPTSGDEFSKSSILADSFLSFNYMGCAITLRHSPTVMFRTIIYITIATPTPRQHTCGVFHHFKQTHNTAQELSHQVTCS